MRSMWKGAVSFGLVMIPVKLYTATETKDIAFRQVHREDGGRIRFRRFCTIDDQEVPYEDVAKGYELADGEIERVALDAGHRRERQSNKSGRQDDDNQKFQQGKGAARNG